MIDIFFSENENLQTVFLESNSRRDKFFFQPFFETVQKLHNNDVFYIHLMYGIV